MDTTPQSIQTRALLAILLTIGFYTLSLLIAGLLLFIIYLEFAEGHVNLRLTLFCLVGAAAILWSILPRRDKFQAPGPQLKADEHPRLFGMIRELAEKTGQPVPDEVYLVPDVNAFVGERSGWFGMGKRRLMGIGLPLFQMLTIDQLRAILAHEFGHYYGGDTQLSPLVYRTRATIIRTVINLAKTNYSWLLAPFRWYAGLYLKLTTAISRRQELVADALAARIAGVKATVEALKLVTRSAPAFDGYMRTELWPMLEAGLRPPILADFQRYLQAPLVVQATQHLEDQALATEKTDPYDTHPCLKDRLQALMRLPEGGASVDGIAPAASLLRCPDDIETALLAHFLKPDIYQGLRAVTWEQSSELCLKPAWEKHVAQYAEVLQGLTAAGIPQALQAPDAFVRKIQQNSRQRVTGEQAIQILPSLLGQALGIALLRHGWELEAPLGCDVTMRQGERSLALFHNMNALAAKQLAPEQWRLLCEQLSIADVVLG